MLKMNKDELLLKEEYFCYKNMTYIERDMCLDYLSHTKDVYNSALTNTEFKIVACTFNKPENGYYTYSGYTSDGKENRSIIGKIIIDNIKIEIKNSTTRLLVNDNKEYTTIDIFNLIDKDEYHQISKYSFDDNSYERNIKLKNYDKNEFKKIK